MKNSVKVIVHRGTHQIGGCCTEISTAKTRILIDFGANLDASDTSRLTVDGISNNKDKCDGILITHYHGDHIGELPFTHSDIPVYMTKKACLIQALYQTHANGKYMPTVRFDKMVEITPGVSFTIGDIRILPIESDHSAFESLMFLIEANGKRILHTGDFRLHGHLRDNLLNQLKKTSKIDLIITEGTTLTRTQSENWSEDTVQKHIERIVSKYKYCFLLGSSSNISRIETVAKSIPRGRYFLMDSFQKEVLSIVNQSVFKKACTYGENLKLKEYGFVMVIRAGESFKRIIEKYLKEYPDDVCLIYSMWSGYLNDEAIKEIYELPYKEKFIVHSSGHVVLSDLNMLLNMLNPNRILFIHTEKSCFDIDLKDRIVSLNDKEELQIGESEDAI